jgi:hypothetical protein
MTDRILFDLASGWALGYDQRQWIVMRAKMRGEESYWNPIAFIASEKRILLRVLLEKDVQPTPEAQKNLDALPERFRDWQAISNARGAA